MRVLLVTNFWHFLAEKGSSRYMTLADMLSLSGADVEVVTSDFYHRTKTKRSASIVEDAALPFRVTLLPEPGYRKNVSLARVRSHRAFSRALRRYLETRRDRPDVIICAVPSLDVAQVVYQYAQREGIRLAIDIQDLWPESFAMKLPVPSLGSFVFCWQKRKADAIYGAADVVMGVSSTFVQRAMSVNERSSKGVVAYLGVELAKFDAVNVSHPVLVRQNSESWIAYCGMLSTSYDLETVIKALGSLTLPERQNTRLVVMGDGEKRRELEALANKLEVTATFTGMVSYPDMVALLMQCDMAVNPIHPKSVASVINKHGDYLAAGLPVINTQVSPEFRSLVYDFKVGINCQPGGSASVAKAIRALSTDSDLRQEMSRNARALALDRFDRATSYQRLVDAVLAPPASESSPRPHPPHTPDQVGRLDRTRHDGRG